jgi:hypothetical protein
MESWPTLMICLLAAAPFGTAQFSRVPRGPTPGDSPGTKQYLIELRDRSFNPVDILRRARQELDPARPLWQVPLLLHTQVERRS